MLDYISEGKKIPLYKIVIVYAITFKWHKYLSQDKDWRGGENFLPQV